MSETERDPLDLAADEVAAVFEQWKKSGLSWGEFVMELGDAANIATRRHRIAVDHQARFAADDGQLPLIPDARIPAPKPPRAKRRVLMHEGPAGVFICPKCDSQSPIPDEFTEAARNRGVPCPSCNPVPGSIHDMETERGEPCPCPRCNRGPDPEDDR